MLAPIDRDRPGGSPYDPRMPRTPPSLRLLAALAGLLIYAESGWTETVLVVCPPELRPAMSDWRRLREQAGRRVTFVDPGSPPDRVPRRKGERLVLLLVGDGALAGEATGKMPARIIRRYGPESTIATDQTVRSQYGADCVARLPFNDPGSLSRYLARVIRREERPINWSDTRVQIAAGIGGFSPMIDAAIEGSARRLLEGLAPLDAEVSLRRGEALGSDEPYTTPGGVWVWLGHGLRNRLPSVPSARVTEISRGADVAVLVACYAGDFAAPGRCVAEQMLDSPEGPLAVIASTRVSMPYGNARLAGELLRGLGAPSALPVGEVLSVARRRSLAESDSPLLASLDPIARLLGADPGMLAVERQEHAAMYVLLGDPLLDVRRTTPHSFTLSDTTSPGSELIVEGWADSPGELRVELNRDRFILDGGERRSASSIWMIDAPGEYRVTVKAPVEWRPGGATVRVGLRSDKGLAVGAATVRIEKPLAVAERPVVVK
ncbi:hypothetical protein MalM25_03620 [Planctomycetes bacterium MalM25]|nr:hypothetical protein MalM25_03620 [Planctomycetes bacterium MalM25]